MPPLNSPRFAWSVAIASLTLWATGASVTLGQAVAGATHQVGQTSEETPGATTLQVTQDATTTTSVDGVDAYSPPCPPLPSAIPQPTPPPAVVPPGAGPQEGTFRLCGVDAQIGHSIEQLVAGRGFSVMLASRGDGCADLTILVASPIGIASRAASDLNVSLGSGQSLSIQIVSEGGATRVSFGSNP